MSKPTSFVLLEKWGNKGGKVWNRWRKWIWSYLDRGASFIMMIWQELKFTFFWIVVSSLAVLAPGTILAPQALDSEKGICVNNHMGVQEGLEILHLIGSKLSICLQPLLLPAWLYGLDSVQTDRAWQWPFLVSKFKRNQKARPNQQQCISTRATVPHFSLNPGPSCLVFWKHSHLWAGLYSSGVEWQGQMLTLGCHLRPGLKVSYGGI